MKVAYQFIKDGCFIEKFSFTTLIEQWSFFGLIKSTVRETTKIYFCPMNKQDNLTSYDLQAYIDGERFLGFGTDVFFAIKSLNKLLDLSITNNTNQQYSFDIEQFGGINNIRNLNTHIANNSFIGNVKLKIELQDLYKIETVHFELYIDIQDINLCCRYSFDYTDLRLLCRDIKNLRVPFVVNEEACMIGSFAFEKIENSDEVKISCCFENYDLAISSYIDFVLGIFKINNNHNIIPTCFLENISKKIFNGDREKIKEYSSFVVFNQDDLTNDSAIHDVLEQFVFFDDATKLHGKYFLKKHFSEFLCVKENDEYKIYYPQTRGRFSFLEFNGTLEMFRDLQCALSPNILYRHPLTHMFSFFLIPIPLEAQKLFLRAILIKAHLFQLNNVVNNVAREKLFVDANGFFLKYSNGYNQRIFSIKQDNDLTNVTEEEYSAMQTLSVEYKAFFNQIEKEVKKFNKVLALPENARDILIIALKHLSAEVTLAIDNRPYELKFENTSIDAFVKASLPLILTKIVSAEKFNEAMKCLYECVKTLNQKKYEEIIEADTSLQITKIETRIDDNPVCVYKYSFAPFITYEQEIHTELSNNFEALFSSVSVCPIAVCLIGKKPFELQKISDNVIFFTKRTDVLNIKTIEVNDDSFFLFQPPMLFVEKKIQAKEENENTVYNVCKASFLSIDERWYEIVVDKEEIEFLDLYQIVPNGLGVRKSITFYFACLLEEINCSTRNRKIDKACAYIRNDGLMEFSTNVWVKNSGDLHKVLDAIIFAECLQCNTSSTNEPYIKYLHETGEILATIGCNHECYFNVPFPSSDVQLYMDFFSFTITQNELIEYFIQRMLGSSVLEHCELANNILVIFLSTIVEGALGNYSLREIGYKGITHVIYRKYFSYLTTFVEDSELLYEYKKEYLKELVQALFFAHNYKDRLDFVFIDKLHALSNFKANLHKQLLQLTLKETSSVVLQTDFAVLASFLIIDHEFFLKAIPFDRLFSKWYISADTDSTYMSLAQKSKVLTFIKKTAPFCFNLMSFEIMLNAFENKFCIDDRYMIFGKDAIEEDVIVDENIFFLDIRQLPARWFQPLNKGESRNVCFLQHDDKAILPDGISYEVIKDNDRYKAFKIPEITNKKEILSMQAKLFNLPCFNGESDCQSFMQIVKQHKLVCDISVTTKKQGDYFGENRIEEEVNSLKYINPLLTYNCFACDYIFLNEYSPESIVCTEGDASNVLTQNTYSKEKYTQQQYVVLGLYLDYCMYLAISSFDCDDLIVEDFIKSIYFHKDTPYKKAPNSLMLTFFTEEFANINYLTTRQIQQKSVELVHKLRN